VQQDRGMDSVEATMNVLRGEITDPAARGDERTSLLGFLQRQRDLVAWKVRGAPEDRLRAEATPSGLTAPGIVRHLTNVERGWIRDTFAGEPGLTFDYSDDDPEGDFRIPRSVSLANLLRDYRVEAERCDRIIAAAGLDDLDARGEVSLRWVLLHLIEEIARHAGHADIIREAIDGATMYELMAGAEGWPATDWLTPWQPPS
jgi:hypothetical protein